jgi:hypothetical protein
LVLKKNWTVSQPLHGKRYEKNRPGASSSSHVIIAATVTSNNFFFAIEDTSNIEHPITPTKKKRVEAEKLQRIRRRKEEAGKKKDELCVLLCKETRFA